MKSQNSQTPPPTLLRHSRRTLAMLASNRKTVKFVERLRPQHDGLKKAVVRVEECEDHVIDCEAAVDMVFLTACDVITEFELFVFADVQKKRDNPRYRVFFPKGLTELKTLSPEKLQDAIVAMVAQLKLLPAEDPLRRHLKGLEQVLAEWKAPFAALDDAKLKLQMAENGLLTAKEAWLDAYTSLYGALQEAFPRQRAFVEAFFPKSKAPKKKEEQKPGLTTTPAT